MSTYEFLLFAHLLFVVTWVGTDIGIQFLSLRVLGAGPQRTVEFTADIEWLGTRLLIPASLLVVVFGVLLVNNVENLLRIGQWRDPDNIFEGMFFKTVLRAVGVRASQAQITTALCSLMLIFWICAICRMMLIVSGTS
jgi:hypothetical protein